MDHTRDMRALLIDQLRADGRQAVLDGESWRVFSPPPFPRDPDAGLLFQDAAWADEALAIPGYTEDN